MTANIVGLVILAALFVGWVCLYLHARRNAEIAVWFEPEDWDDEDEAA